MKSKYRSSSIKSINRTVRTLVQWGIVFDSDSTDCMIVTVSKLLYSNNFRYEYSLSLTRFLFFTFDFLKFERIVSVKIFTKLCEQRNFFYIMQHGSLLIFSHHKVFSRCVHLKKKINFFIMIIELIFIAINWESLTCYKHWKIVLAQNNLYYICISVAFYSVRSKYVFLRSLKWIKLLFIDLFIFE